MDLTNPTMRPKIIRTLVHRYMYAKVANEVLYQLDINLENNVEEAVTKQAVKYGLTDETLLQRVNMLKCKREYYKKKSTYEKAIKDVLINKNKSVKEIADNYEIDETELSNAVLRARRNKLCKYNKKPENSIEVFSYSEEDLLLKELKNWIETNHPDCICQVCVFELLSRFAFKFAQDKNMLNICPDYWIINHHADINWLQEFEIRHCTELYNAYSTNPCLKDPTINKFIFKPPY